MLAPSAFMAFAASTLLLQNLCSRRVSFNILTKTNVRLPLHGPVLSASVPSPEFQHIQKVWDQSIVDNQLADISSKLSCEVDKARVLSASYPHSGDWLMAPPVTSIGVRLNHVMIRIAVVFGLGLRTCEPYTSPCGKEIDTRCIHDLSCSRSTARQQFHADLNDIVCRALKRAQIPVTKEPVGLTITDQVGQH